MIKAHFHPVAIDHNVGGNDAKILKEFKEPAWNFQVIRFIDLQIKDLIPRKDRVNTIGGVAKRMISALEAAKIPVPDQFKVLAKKVSAPSLTARERCFLSRFTQIHEGHFCRKNGLRLARTAPMDRHLVSHRTIPSSYQF